MSAIALSWVATIKVGNQTAKQLLQFYACHNYPTFIFKNSTLANQLEVTERGIQLAIKKLVEAGLITVKSRFDEDGRQTSNEVVLNIPPEFSENFFGENRGEGERRSGGRVNDVRGEGERSAPLYNTKGNIKEKIKSKEDDAPKKLTFCPSDFTPNAGHYRLGEELGVNVDAEVPQFIDRNLSVGEKRIDWNRTFNTWIRNTLKFSQTRKYNHARQSTNKSQKFNNMCKGIYTD